MNSRSKLEIRQASVTVEINENAGLVKGYQCGPKGPKENTCPFQISMYGVVLVKVVETFGNI